MLPSILVSSIFHSNFFLSFLSLCPSLFLSFLSLSLSLSLSISPSGTLVLKISSGFLQGLIVQMAVRSCHQKKRRPTFAHKYQWSYRPKTSPTFLISEFLFCSVVSDHHDGDVCWALVRRSVRRCFSVRAPGVLRRSGEHMHRPGAGRSGFLRPGGLRLVETSRSVKLKK